VYQQRHAIVWLGLRNARGAIVLSYDTGCARSSLMLADVGVE